MLPVTVIVNVFIQNIPLLLDNFSTGGGGGGAGGGT